MINIALRNLSSILNLFKLNFGTQPLKRLSQKVASVTGNRKAVGDRRKLSPPPAKLE